MLNDLEAIDTIAGPGVLTIGSVTYDLAAGRVLCLAEHLGRPHVTQLAIDLERLGNGDLETTDEAKRLCRRLLDLPEVAAALEGG